ncbi:MAG: alpha-mannosidase [Oscillospiraceae bacterium]|jgi:alpha-mannosidase|nr:alpha-mannosidase [Oscillospiraceae bacterium]MCI1990913.1 alpha-mannosidase [Oscillospiraceae bacterium]MCI2036140.1 alpha-mannosidase [Oscillospiraceae bacterium]
MIFSEERAQVICGQLKKLEKVRKQDITSWKIKDGLFLRPREADESRTPWKDFDSLKAHWYGRDRHYWFRTDLTVPESFDGKPLWLVFHTQIDDTDDGRNPQFLLFVNGQVTQGLDINHREVFLTDHARAGDSYRLDLQAYTGILHTEFRLIAEMVQVDPEIRNLYYDMQVPLWSFARMEKDSKTRLDMAGVLNHAVNLLDFRVEYSEDFYRSVRAADAYLQKALYQDMAGYDDVIATCIGHTHIDVAWWWTVAQTREKVVRSFATVLKLMDEYPGYKFMSSQPQLYEFLKERYPDVYSRLKERVKQRRWEPEGAMWLEADCNLTSGESLVRQILFGKRFFREEFGVDSKVLWLPDAFGFNGALPQIMKKSGIRYFMTTKLSWNQFNKIPNDTFLWRGIDGSEILTHFITTLGVGQSAKNFFTTYNGMLHPDAIMGAWERYQNKEINNDVLIAFGYGDGGGGPTRQMLETSKRMEKGLHGVPKVRQEFSETYFEELERRVKDNPQLHTWEGEFYFEYHRGTYTSVARNKRANRKSELMLMDLELLSVLAGRSLPYPGTELNAMWKNVLLNQFHDILPGSSIHEVYEVTKKEYEKIAETGAGLIGKRLRALAGSGKAVAAFNTLGFARGALLQLGKLQAASLVRGGKRYPVQRTENGAVAYVDALPSKGYRSFAVSAEPDKTENPFRISERWLETPFYRVALDGHGLFSSVYDKQNGREVLQAGRRGNQMRVYEDKPIYFDNWDIDIYYTEKFWDVDGLVKMEWVERGPVRAALRLERKFSKSTIRQTVYFYADNRRIDFQTAVDWKEHQHLLKVHFPVEIHSDEATFEIQFGNVTRKTHRNTSWDVARFESCGHRWIDVSEGGYGVSLLNDCKYGHSVHNGDMALTLIKSGIEPNKTADQEKHVFTYSLYPHAGTWREAGTAREAACLNQPAYAVPEAANDLDYSLFRVDAENMMADTVKKAEDGNGIILRMYEYQNRRGKASVRLADRIAKVSECDLMENDLAELPYDGREFSFDYKPYEIKTFRVILEP